MVDKEAIRPVYSELQGCLAEAPTSEKYRNISNSEFWEDHNITVDELCTVTGKDYSKYKFAPMEGYADDFITVEIYRKKLGGIIARLHGEYFKDEPAPFASMPSTVINQTQSVQVELAIELTSLIDKQLFTAEEGSKKKSFFEKIKGSLSSVKSIAQFTTLLMQTARQMNLSVEELCTWLG